MQQVAAQIIWYHHIVHLDKVKDPAEREWYMRKFAGAWRDSAIVQELLAQITWYHHIALLDKVKNPAEREWYIRETIQHGWSRNVLVVKAYGHLHLPCRARTSPAIQGTVTDTTRLKEIIH